MVNNFKFLLSIQFFMTETIKDMESFPDGEPKELKGYEKTAPREKTFLEKISATAGLAGVATLLEMAVPSPVQAEDKITLRSTQKPENFAVWANEAPSSEGVIYYDVDGKNLTIEASPNAPMSFKGRCPTPDSHGNWIPIVETNKGTSYPATVHTDLKGTVRSELNGFGVDTTAPQIAGDEVTGTVKCVLDNNPTNKVADKGEDHQDLVFKIASVAVGRNIPHGEAPRVEYVAPPTTESSDDSVKGEHRVNMEGAAVGFNPAEGGWGPGFEAKVGWDPIGSTRDQVKRFTLGALYRYVNIGEGEGEHFKDTDTHTAAARFGWNPVVYDGAMCVAIDIGVAAGVSITQQEPVLKDGRKAPDATNPIGTFDGGLEFGWENVRGKIGGFYTLSEHPVQEGGGVTGGVKIDFQ